MSCAALTSGPDFCNVQLELEILHITSQDLQVDFFIFAVIAIAAVLLRIAENPF